MVVQWFTCQSRFFATLDSDLVFCKLACQEASNPHSIGSSNIPSVATFAFKYLSEFILDGNNRLHFVKHVNMCLSCSTFKQFLSQTFYFLPICNAQSDCKPVSPLQRCHSTRGSVCFISLCSPSAELRSDGVR